MAKHRSFKIDKFINAVGDELLRRYLTEQHDIATPKTVITPESYDKILSKEAEAKRKEIEEDLQCINDIAGQHMDCIEEAVQKYKIDKEEDEPPERTAMRVKLHSEEAFEIAFDKYLYLLFNSEKLSHYQFPEGKTSFQKGAMSQFRKAVEEYFQKLGKSDNCKIRQQKDGEKHVFLVARGDYIQSHIAFDKGEIKYQIFRPLKEDMLVYDERNHVLSIRSASRGLDEKEKYVEIFGKSILGMSHVDDKTLKSKMVVLEPFINEAFDFAGNEHIEKVSPVAIIAHTKVGRNRTISLTDKENAIEAMKYELRNHKNMELISVKLRFFINRVEKKSKSVTVELRPPEGTRIPSQEWQNIIEEYLHEQGVLLV